MLKGNKGEWGELYAFCYLLRSGELHAADKDLNVLGNIYFPIIKIIREENPGMIYSYHPGKKIKILLGDSFVKEIDNDELGKAIATMLTKIPLGKSAFKIQEVNGFFADAFCEKLKASSTKKQDIVIQLHDINTGVAPVCGFSIKSYLGANPTLINPGKNTNFVFVVNNCNDEIMQQTNHIETKTKIIDKMEYLLKRSCSFTPNEYLLSPQFEENLKFVDTVMPKFLSLAVLYSYQYKLNNSHLILSKMKELNPLNFTNLAMYDYKYKKLLSACALGMTPGKNWTGDEDANGGYIAVRRDGIVVCYHIYKRGELEQYLVDHTRFDRASMSRYDYMSIYKDGNDYKIKLNLQIRFM